ncbi:MAG: hypothetical protein CMO43_12180 [Verrucomicrobiales bacterium]|jgi:hypothetical protein|nr:hypothetical protein [Verrucomicrobiales bacterium]MDP6677998.1 hypothetical protein [Verrucomicrobiota bacterium]MDP6754474.1 hypothetical protein [Verrucomicrobiota bacterium]|tara:strand:- start:59 stop:244 length:186 start_codon:yes stop_codon:yes gene_type:complete
MIPRSNNGALKRTAGRIHLHPAYGHLLEKESNRTRLAKLTLSKRERVGEREKANNKDELFF